MNDFSVHVDRLDRIVSRVLQADPVLKLERESEKHWLVVDTANADEHGDASVMVRHPDRVQCEIWARCFVARTPGVTLDYPSFTSVEGEPVGGAGLTAAPVSQAEDAHLEPASPSRHLHLVERKTA